jgi:hypothetical protein
MRQAFALLFFCNQPTRALFNLRGAARRPHRAVLESE